MRYFFLLALLIGQPAWGSPTDFQALLPKGAQMGLLVLDDQGSVLSAHQADTLMLPASTIKLFTATAAWLELGADFRYHTELSGPKVTGGLLRGDLTLTMRGDPTLTRADLFHLFSQLRRQGVERIDGDLIIDGLSFEGYDRARGWPWDDLGICFAAPASAYILDHGCAHVRLVGNAQRSSVQKPAHLPITVDSQVRLTGFEKACPLEMDRLGDNRYRLRGCANRNTPLALAIQDPAPYLTEVVKQQLAELGLSLKGQIRFGAGGGAVLVRHQSEPLESLLRTLLHDSDNQLSDSLLRTLAQARLGRGSFQMGAEVMNQSLKRHLGLDLSQAELVDGSGLSRYNLVTPNQLGQLLHHWQHSPKLHGLSELLPVAGVSGTLKHRAGTQPVKGLLRAKSGSFGQVANLAGFLDTQAGDTLVVVQMVSGLVGDEAARRAQLTEFEQLWYGCLVNRCLPELQRQAQLADTQDKG
ncbi:D-alanyl-D-alanine carboxypeptidase/D-alanyl-D-alanine-endopeptidase [Ferrimonas balearica]|uniref:D-alanyl-D-alanine carboxypeptidase/D-alanyl-D-alanine endopeptidase n=1 Tax=Ferrimonas balearica TaxID=44012 RepID=UPI001C995928|nr:D-alanyl-D-alanine carboxypeptidase/D-alanyl-D-alanine-endopeptidase [Ferrimonas balearica]MBY5991637.1 D-alanyl-D-alanine carboxypeptidase/D-alanyl-D-alanine-endopeptidase [Ferrimonas balearica]